MQAYGIAIGGLLAFLFLSGCAGSYCATEKGRNWLEGFLLGVILGPCGAVAVACLPTIEPDPEIEHEEDEDAMLRRIKAMR